MPFARSFVRFVGGYVLFNVVLTAACAGGSASTEPDAAVVDNGADASVRDATPDDTTRLDLGLVDLGMTSRDANAAEGGPADAQVDMGVPGCSEPLTWLAEDDSAEQWERTMLMWGRPDSLGSYLNIRGTTAFFFNGNDRNWWNGSLDPSISGLDTSEFSIEAWFAPIEPGDERVGPTFSNGAAALFLHMSRWAFYVGGSGLALGTPVATSSTGDTWTHVVGTWSAGTPPVLKLFVNGRELTGSDLTVTRSDGSPPATMNLSGPMRIGGSLPAGDRPYSGAIDDIRLHCTALSPESVRTRCNQGVPVHRVTCAM